jgi:pyocin large subunit-like protein
MRVVILLGAAALCLALAACDAGQSATAKAPPASSGASSSGAAALAPGSAGAGAQAASTDPRDLPAPMFKGKPMWAANRRHTAQENADYQFDKNGKDFGAVNESDYLAKVHHFVEAPPAGVQRIQRANGDSLLYDAKSNTFAVVTKTGAPRTMFKPRDGAAYWRQQVSREQSRANGDDNSQS